MVCKPLRKLAKWFGRGVPYETRLRQSDRYMDSVLRALGHGKRADVIKFGMPSDDEDEQKLDFAPRKRKKEAVVKPEAVEAVKKEEG